MRARFSENEYSDLVLEIVSLKQYNTVEEYYEEFKSLLNLLQLQDEYGLIIFMSNLKPKLSKPVRLFYPKTLTHAFNLAMESIIFNIPRKPYLPYRNSQYNFQSPNIHQPPPRHELPPLLPTPRPSLLQNPKPPFLQNQPSTKTTTYPSYTKLLNTKVDAFSVVLTKAPTKQERD